MLSQLGSIAYRAARKVMTLDITAVIWLERNNLVLPAVGPEITLRFLAARDIERFSRDPANDLPRVMGSRIDHGRDFCFAALSQDRLASYAWFALGSIEAEHQRGAQPNSGVAVSFSPGVAFLYKGFTHPSFRGHKLYGAVAGHALMGLAPHGISSILSTMDWTNGAARAALGRIGFEELGLCWRWGWGAWMHTHAPRAARRRGALFGSRAVVERRADFPLTT